MVELKKEVAAADAVIFATPEYNWGYSAAIKNAVDFVSVGGNSFVGKSALVISTGGLMGGNRAVMQFRQVREAAIITK